ncbi:hypothetical protein T439DRAFT_31730 [Meredithblackwellia eburnea MCA 4105]
MVFRPRGRRSLCSNHHISAPRLFLTHHWVTKYQLVMQDSVLSGLFDLPEPVPQGLKINKTQMWTEDERRRLKDAVAIHGKDWKTISELVGGGRTPGACDKYYYYNFEGGRKSVSNVLVAPSIFKKNAGGARRKWTMHEEETMEHEVRKGKTWQQVSEIIGSRTPAACKEHWRVMKSLHSPAEEFEIVEISSSSDSDFPQESSKHIHKRTRKQKKNDHPKDQYYSIFDTDSSSDSSGQSDLSHSARRAHS